MERSRSPPQVEPREENLRGQGFSLIIRNLARETTLEELKLLFEPFGVIIDAYIPRDHRTGRHRGFGFMEFRDQRDADTAISSLNGHQFLGRSIDVCFATQKRKTRDEMRDRMSRGGYGDRDRDRGRDGYGGGGGSGGGGYGRRGGYDGGRDRDGPRRGRSHSRERERERGRGRYDDRRHRSRSRGSYRDDRGGERGGGRYRRESPRRDERRGRSPSYEVSDR